MCEDGHSSRHAASDARRWDCVRRRWRAEFGDAVYRPWLARLIPQRGEGGAIQFVAPTRFMSAWIEDRYLARLAGHVRAEFPDAGALSILAAEPPETSAAAPHAAPEAVAAPASAARAAGLSHHHAGALRPKGEA